MSSPSFLSLVFLEFLCHESFLHNKLGFLDAHGSHCTTTVYIHLIFFFLCNSILEKLHFMLLHVESRRFLLLVSSWVIVVIASVVNVTTTSVINAEGCWCYCYQRELTLLQEGARVLLVNRVEILNKFQRSPSFYLSFFLFHA